MQKEKASKLWRTFEANINNCLLTVIFSSYNVWFLDNSDLQTFKRKHFKEKNTFWGETHLALERHWPLVGETGPWASSLPTSWSLGLAASRWILLNHFSHSSCFSQVFAMLRGGHRTWRTHKEEKSIRDPKTASPWACVVGNFSSPTTWQIEQVHKSLKQIYSKIQKGITLLMDEKETCMDTRVWAPLWGHPTLELIKSVWSNKKPSRSTKPCRSEKKQALVSHVFVTLSRDTSCTQTLERRLVVGFDESLRMSLASLHLGVCVNASSGCVCVCLRVIPDVFSHLSISVAWSP